MHPRTQELLAHFEANRALLKSAFDAIPLEERNQPPEPGRWSPAAIVEHLALVEGRIAGILSSRINEERAAGLAGETHSEPILPTLDVARARDRTIRVQAPEFAVPTGLDEEAAWSLLDQATAALRAMLLSGDGLALANVIHPHSRLGPMSVYHWIAFLAAHEARHTAQIREMSGPNSPA
jgi:uncharacterized damage-inducible protein DinB